MKRLWLLIFPLIACASVPQKDIALVRLAPPGPHICADDTWHGKPMKTMMVFVNQPYGEKEPVTVTVTDGTVVDLTTIGLEFPAGLGRHRIVVKVGNKEFIRTFRIYQCRDGIKPARME